MPSYVSKFLTDRVQSLIAKNKPKAAQGSDEWHRFRYDHLNASEAYAVISNEKLGKTAARLRYEKCVPFEAPGATVDPYFLRGHEQEPVIRKIYSETTGSTVHDQFGSFQHYRHPFLAASVDGITDKGVVVEIKSRSKILPEIPFRDWVQVQLQLEVMNLHEADYVQGQLAKLEDGTFRLIDYKCIPVERNHGWFKKHALPLFKKFWKSVSTHRKEGVVPEPDTEWVVATDIRNYSLGDPLIDYLERHNRSRKKIDHIPEYSFGNFFCKRGIEFEAKVVAEIAEQFGSDFVTVWRFGQPTNDSIFEATAAAMRAQIPILYHAPIRNSQAKTWGIPDLLVRADFLNKIVQHPVGVGESQHPLDLPYGRLPYYVVDIKLGVLDLTANGKTLYNNTKTRAYKGQLGFYNAILQTYPGQTSINKAFIIGRKWHYTCRGVEFTGNHWYERYGEIHFDDFDAAIPALVAEAVDWIRDLRANGDKWTIDPPSRPELKPNMKNDEDESWKELKEQLAIKNGEITLLWQCGVKNRQFADAAGIKSIFDPAVTAESLGVFGPYQSYVLNNILAANRAGRTDPIYIRDRALLRSPGAEWLNNTHQRVFIDYETISDLVQPDINGDLVFMIGAWFNGRYKSWVVNRLARSQELEITRDFFAWLRKLRDAGPVALYYWSPFEATQTNKLLERHQLYNERTTWNSCAHYDLCREIQQAGVAVRGAFNYKLKKVTNALYHAKAIKTHWGNNECSDGLKAMVMTFYLNEQTVRSGKSLKRHREMKNIIAYNKIDCKSMYSILEYITKRARDRK